MTNQTEAMRAAFEAWKQKKWPNVGTMQGNMLHSAWQAATAAAQAGVPEGWRLVPKEPTMPMLQAACANRLETVRQWYKAMLASAPSPPAAEPWQPIETAPKDHKIDIWINASSLAGDGVRWCDCYYDQICDEWRTSRPSGFLVTVKARHVTHWMECPQPPTTGEAK